MALIDTQQTMDAYIHDLINRGDYFAALQRRRGGRSPWDRAAVSGP
jgi:hypothetical protein